MADQINTEEEREKFEAWREREPWYTVAKAAADDDGLHSDSASIFRMMNIAASEAWQARALLSASQPVAGQGKAPSVDGLMELVAQVRTARMVDLPTLMGAIRACAEQLADGVIASREPQGEKP